MFAVLTRRRNTFWWLLLPLGVTAWVLMHASGIHATIAGVLLGFTVPAQADGGEQKSLSERFEHRWRPISAGAAVPLFALTAAGVSLTGGGITGSLSDPAGLGVGAGLVLGKLLGIFGATYLLARFTRATLDQDLSWWDVLGIALLSGIGFTVSLLIGELAFEPADPRQAHVKTAVLLASLTSALLAALILRWRNRVYQHLRALENTDADHDGVPDIYQDRPQE